MHTPRNALDLRALGATAWLVQRSLGAQGIDTSVANIKREARALLTRDPIDTVAVTVLSSTWLFYLAEREVNPKVGSFWDALVFITTCLSVGYSDVFARTDSGKAIASFVMTLGPSLSAALLQPPNAERQEERREEARAAGESLAVQKALLSKLEAILAELQKTP